MNDLGGALAWLAVQVALLMVPSLGLQALAARRGPAAGAWVATVGLGMVVLLGLLAFLPESRPGVGEATDQPSAVAPPAVAALASPDPGGPPGPAGPIAGRGRLLSGFQLAWGRLERRAAGPIAGLRPWGGWLALAWLAGAGVGGLRMLVGLWAVELCRRRGRAVDDPAMVGLVGELRRAMGCGRAVELREIADLTTPATAGWFRPILLLPGDWRAWGEAERRAVVAHELAHVVRGDYAAGLLARVAVVSQAYHPLVRWMAARLHLGQELAADALGAEFAGGRRVYLLALSRLALEQDGRPPSWPARAFLPAQGTLIRRIAMLKDEPRSDLPWTGTRRLVAALGLLSLTIGVASWKAPAQGEDSKLGTIEIAGVVARKASADAAAVEPFEVRYIPDGKVGVVAVRPAAALRRTGMDMLSPLLRELIDINLPQLARDLKVDMARPGFLKLECKDIESVVVGFDIGQADAVPGPGQQERRLHRLDPSGLTIRTVAPFDWPAFIRQWNLGLEEVREARGVYYKIKGPKDPDPAWDYCFYLPDDRTIVFDGERWMKQLIARPAPAGPAFLEGADWGRSGRDLAALALDNRDDLFAKRYDLGRPDDAMVLSLFKGVDRWVLGLTDADELAPHAEVAGRDPQAIEAVSRSVAMLANLGRAALALDAAPPATGEGDRALKLAKGFLANLNVQQDGKGLSVGSGKFGTFADIAMFFKAQIQQNREAQAAGGVPRDLVDPKIRATGAELKGNTQR